MSLRIFASLCALWALLLCHPMILRVVLRVRRKGGRKTIAAAAAQLLCCIVILEYYLRLLRPLRASNPAQDLQGFRALQVLLAAKLPGNFLPILLALALLALTAQTVLALRAEKRRAEKSITPMSVKESLDALPDGLCCYDSGGLCKLVNRRMEELSLALTGRRMRDGEGFWRMLQGQTLPKGTFLRTGDQPVVRLETGEAVAFRRSELELDGAILYEILAAGVTAEFDLVAELEEKEAAYRKVNQRLRELGAQITELTAQREILNSKIRIHDDWGRALLAARKYLADPNTPEKEEFSRIWRRNIRLLESKEQESNKGRYEDVFRNAKVLGLGIAVDGDLPEGPVASGIAVQAMTTCLSNLVRHAGGRTLFVRVTRESGRLRMEFTNDGQPPKEPPEETGGLLNLRRKATAEGCRMTLQHTPEFRLILEMEDEDAR